MDLVHHQPHSLPRGYYILLGALRQEAPARDAERRDAYNRNLVILVVLWLLYPIFVILEPDGFMTWTATFTAACVTILDLVAKLVYGFIAMAGTRKVTDGDLARGDVTPTKVETPAVSSTTRQPACVR